MPKSEAILEAIVPGRVISRKNTLDEIKSAMREEANKIKALFEKTTRTWKNKPEFVTEIALPGRGGQGLVSVSTDNQVWSWLDEGTEPHLIFPRRARMLRFNTQFRAKTRPGYLTSYNGSSGPPVAYSRGVLHPGTEPRDWTKAVEKRQRRSVNKALKGAIERSIEGEVVRFI